MSKSSLVQALAQVCQAHLLDEKWLLAPSLRVGNQWVDAVARTGQAAVNVHIKTLKSLALDLAAPQLSTHGARLLSSRAGTLLIDRIFRQLQQHGLEYLGELRASIGLAGVLYRSVQSLRLAGIDEQKLAKHHFEVDAKGRDVQRILGEYRRELRQSGLLDSADVLQLAIQQLRGDHHALDSHQLVVVPADLPARGLEQQLLDALPEPCRLSLTVDLPVNDRADATASPTDLALLRWLPRAVDAPSAVADGTVEFFHAVGEVNEVREVLRRITAARVPLDDVELLHTDVQTYVALVYEILAGLAPDSDNDDEELPGTFADGIPTRFFRPGRLLAAWVRWVREGFPQSRLVAMIREGLLIVPETDESKYSNSRLAAVLRNIGIGLGQQRYLPKLDEEFEAAQRRLARVGAERDDEDQRDADDRRASCARRLEELRLLRRLIVPLIQAAPAGTASPCDILEAAIQTMKHVARTVNKSDNFARQRLIEELIDLQNWLRDEAISADLDIWSWLTRLPDESRVLGSGPQPGRLHVAGLLSGGHSGRGHSYVVGLDDSRFPGAGSQDPLLLDAERSAISTALPTAGSQLEQRLSDFHRLLARLRGRVTLSFSSHDLVDDRDKFPASQLLAAYRLIAGNREGSQEDFLKWLGRPASFAPIDDACCLNTMDWWLNQLCAGAPVHAADRLVLHSYPHLARGSDAMAQRGSAEFTPYDGSVALAGSELDPTLPDGPVMSSHRLEMIGECPLKFFFGHGLQIQPPEELVLDPTRWLDPLAAGQLMHEVFERFVRELIRQNRPPRYPDDLPELQSLLQARAAQYRDWYPPPSEQVYRAQMADFRRVVRTFLVEEARYGRETGNRPVYLEASLGMYADGDRSEIDTDQPIPLTLPDGTALRVRGRVDRIDAVSRGDVRSFMIWDYKTGSAARYAQADPFRQGRVVQPAVYIAMVEHCLKQAVKGKSEVVRFGFFFPGRRQLGSRMQWTRQELADGNSVLLKLVQIVRHGAFLATDKEDSCRYCEYSRICGDTQKLAEASKMKLAQASNTSLQPLQELRSHGTA